MAQQQKFKKGDVVQLKSGGPRMTVEDEESTSGDVYCHSFAGAKLEGGSF